MGHAIQQTDRMLDITCEHPSQGTCDMASLLHRPAAGNTKQHTYTNLNVTCAHPSPDIF